MGGRERRVEVEGEDNFVLKIPGVMLLYLETFNVGSLDKKVCPFRNSLCLGKKKGDIHEKLCTEVELDYMHVN